MNTQTVRTNPVTLGPFLTLIIDAGRKADSPNENPLKVCCSKRVYPIAIFRQEEDATDETQTIDVRRQALGPFVSLILRLLEEMTVERLRFEAEYNRRRPPLCARVYIGR